MRDIVSPLSGFGSPFGQRRRAAQIITAIISPALGPMTDGDTIASALSADIGETSNYASTEGTIASVNVAITVNSDPALASDTVDFADVVSVVVTVTDSEANQRVFTLGRTVAGIAPTNDVAPAIAGDTGLGDTLTVTAGTWLGVPEPTLAYQWLRGGVEIAGETGTTYDITLADSGALITVRETATNAEGSASEVSNAITADTFAAPVNTVAPSISGDTDLGATLTRTDGTWSGNPTPTLSGQWQRDGAAISGATGATYVIVEDDQGTDITYLETATNAVGSAAQVSNALAIPEASAFDPDALAYITAVETADGESLEAGVREAINDFVVGCKADGIWDALKASCIMAGARTLNGALVPLRGPAPTNFNFVSADYNRLTGLKGDGSTKYIDTNRDASLDGTTNMHMSLNVTERSPGNNRFISAAGLSEILEGVDANSFRARANSSDLQTHLASLGTTGLFGISRADSAGYTWRASGSTDFQISEVGSPSLSNYEIFKRVGDSFYFAGRANFYSVGNALDLTALNARVTALMAAFTEALT